MTTSHKGTLLPIELPIMYVAPHRSLAYVYMHLDDLATLDQVRQAVSAADGVVRALYTYDQSNRGAFLVVLTLDTTDAAAGLAGILQRLSAVRGVQVIDSTAPTNGLAASERHTIQVAGTPMVVMAREVLGGTLKALSSTAGHDTVYQTGVAMGSQAATAVPPLLNQLGLPLTLDLLRQRLMDFQVFGWAQVKKVSIDDSLHGEIELDKTFESTAWAGQATRSTCDFIRGFTVGVFSLAFDRSFASAEPQCQGKGDAVCRITFQPAAA